MYEHLESSISTLTEDNLEHDFYDSFIRSWLVKILKDINMREVRINNRQSTCPRCGWCQLRDWSKFFAKYIQLLKDFKRFHKGEIILSHFKLRIRNDHLLLRPAQFGVVNNFADRWRILDNTWNLNMNVQTIPYLFNQPDFCFPVQPDKVVGN